MQVSQVFLESVKRVSHSSPMPNMSSIVATLQEAMHKVSIYSSNNLFVKMSPQSIVFFQSSVSDRVPGCQG